MTLLSLAGVKVKVPQHRDGAGMGQGLAKATEQVRARVRAGATLRPCPGSSGHLPGPGQSVQGKETYTGSCEPQTGKGSPPCGTRAQFPELCEQRTPARSRVGG